MKYTFQGGVQFFEGKPSICGDSIKWFESITVKAFTERRAIKKILRRYNELYPEYLGYILLY